MRYHWEHWHSLRGVCPVCGAPSHIGMSINTAKIYWLHDKYDALEFYRSHGLRGPAEVSWEEFERLRGEAKEQGDESKGTIGGVDNSKRVRCIETGTEYPSIQAAADAVKRNRVSLTTAIKRSGTCAGLHWELCD